MWGDNKLLKERDPIYGTIIKTFPQGPGSLRTAANFRYTAMLKEVNDVVNAYMKGQMSVADAMSRAVQAGNVVLSQ